MRLLIRLAVLAVLLAVAVPLLAHAQWDTITTNNVNPATTGQPIKIGPVGSEVRIETDGSLNPQTANADGYVFLAAIDNCVGSTTNLTPTRVAANDWALARTATAYETINIACSLNSWLQRVGGIRGVKITALTLHHQITVGALHAATLNKVATRNFANNVANVVNAGLATATMPTAVQTNPYATAVTITSAAFLPANTATDLNIDFSVDLRNAGVYRLYGIGVSFSKI